MDAKVSAFLNTDIPVTPAEGRILELLICDGTRTPADLASLLDVTLGTVRRHLTALRDLELLERDGSKRYGHWVVKL